MSNSNEQMSAFDRDFGGDGERVEETIVLRDSQFQFLEGFDPDDEQVMQQFRLEVVHPDGQERAYPIRGEVTLGRSDDNHIVIDSDRSVSGRHMAVNTDGKLYWFQDLNSRHGTFVNGERMQEGWLTGDEELVIGNTKIYFRTPVAIVAPPPELEEAEQKYKEAEEAEEEQQEEQEEKAPPKKKSALPILFLLFLLLAGGGGAYYYMYIYNPEGATSTNGKSDDKEPLQIALASFQKGKKFLEEKKWFEADKAFRKAASEVPANNPLQKEVLKFAAKAEKEVAAITILRKAKKTYLEADKPLKALAMLRKVSLQTHLYSKALAFKKRILKKELQPMLTQFQVYTESRKCEKAAALIPKMKVFSPKKEASWKEQLQACKEPGLAKDTSSSKGKKTTKRSYRRGRRGRRGSRAPASFQKGFDLFAKGSFTRAYIFFRRQQSVGSSRSMRKKARYYSKQVKAFQKYMRQGKQYQSSNTSTAIRAYRKAETANKTLGGGQKSAVKRALGRLYAKDGMAALRKNRLLHAASSFKKSMRYGSSLGRKGLKKLEKKAKELFTQAEALKGVADGEAKKLLKKVLLLLPRNHPLARKARQNL